MHNGSKKDERKKKEISDSGLAPSHFTFRFCQQKNRKEIFSSLFSFLGIGCLFTLESVFNMVSPCGLGGVISLLFLPQN